MGIDDDKVLLFDLDGTLLDTAPDMVGTVNRLRAERALEPLPVSELRSYVNGGAAALIAAGIPGLKPTVAESLKQRFLDYYGQAPAEETRPFPGILELLDALDERQIRWGVVTNKMHRFTVPVLEKTALAARCVTIVSGDTAAHSKPHPAPVLHACEEASIAPEHAIMIGDSSRDIAAGKAAGAATVAVSWGFIEAGDDPTQWGADEVFDHPDDLRRLLPC